MKEYKKVSNEDLKWIIDLYMRNNNSHYSKLITDVIHKPDKLDKTFEQVIDGNIEIIFSMYKVEKCITDLFIDRYKITHTGNNEFVVLENDINENSMRIVEGTLDLSDLMKSYCIIILKWLMHYLPNEIYENERTAHTAK